MKLVLQLCRFAALVIGMLSVLPCPTDAAAVGMTRLLSYQVNMTIVNRFAQTNILVEVLNEKNCSTTKGLTLQLPRDARVTKLKMDSGNQCRMDGVVKEEGQAKQEFQDSASQGKPAALLKAYDTTNYGVQLSLLPEGRTVLEIQLEQLLQRQRGVLDFQVPIYPGLPVDLLTFDLSIDEGESGISTIGFITDYDDVDDSAFSGLQVTEPSSDGSNMTVATAHMEQSDVKGTSSSVDGISPLPRLLRGFYDPGPLPAEGLLIPDPFGTCFVHLFNPNTVLAGTGSLPRNIVFVIDLSGSMSGQKLDDAKAAFAAIIHTLTDADYFTVHTFADSGVEQRYGPERATNQAKEAGRDFVHNLDIQGGTNLNDAYVEGIRQLQTMGNGDFATYVPVLLVLTDGQPSVGTTDPQSISRNVKAVNGDGVNAKIYGLAFGNGADFGLLSAISLQNGGRATRIYEGYGDAVTQMEEFYVGNLGTVLLSDVNVAFNGSVIIDSHTQTQFPIFADGSEVAVRARVLGGGGAAQPTAVDADSFLQATTTANTANGLSTWRTEVSGWGENSGLLLPTGNEKNECVQSFAHGKIAELMLFRDAATKLGPEMDSYYDLYSLENGLSSVDVSRGGSGRRHRREQDIDVVSQLKDDALQLALEAGVVWPGLTAMVTVESDECNAQAAEDVEVCYDGDGQGHEYDGSMEGEDHGGSLSYGAMTSAAADISRTQAAHGGAPPPPPPATYNSVPVSNPLGSPNDHSYSGESVEYSGPSSEYSGEEDFDYANTASSGGYAYAGQAFFGFVPPILLAVVSILGLAF